MAVSSVTFAGGGGWVPNPGTKSGSVSRGSFCAIGANRWSDEPSSAAGVRTRPREAEEYIVCRALQAWRRVCSTSVVNIVRWYCYGLPGASQLRETKYLLKIENIHCRLQCRK